MNLIVYGYNNFYICVFPVEENQDNSKISIKKSFGEVEKLAMKFNLTISIGLK